MRTRPTTRTIVVREERDRRDDGRPEQARPRDRTGRPLPRGTTGVLLSEEHDPPTVDEALRLGIRLWDERRYFEAHECLEQVWHAASDGERDLWQGVIQVAVAGVHVQRDNPAGASALLRRAADKLARYPETARGIAVAELLAFCRDAEPRALAGSLDSEAFPAFPSAGPPP